MAQPIVFVAAAGDERGRIAEDAFNAVAARMGLPWRACVRDSVQGDARLVVCLSEAEQRISGVVYWQTPQGPLAKAFLEREVMTLIAKLFGGGEAVEVAPSVPSPPPKPAAKPTATVGRETKGRRGKGVTIVSDLALGEEPLRQLAATLKQRCGTGGTVEDGRILIQGDLRERIVGELEKLGYRVKRSGG